MINNPKDISLTNGLLIDGTGAAPVPNATVNIRDGRIEAAGAGLPAGTATQVIDLEGRTILPGFFNCHVHRAFKTNVLRAWAQEGVTTVRDLGSNSRLDQYAKRDRLMEYNRNARLVCVGPIVTAIRGYGMLRLESPEQAGPAIRKLAQAGANLVKIGIEHRLQFRNYNLASLELIRAIVEAAHSCNLWVSAHITRLHHVELAIEAGVDDLAHMAINKVPDEVLEKMVMQKMMWVPTMELWDGVSKMYKDDWYSTASDNLRRFVAAGGDVAVGTDYSGYVVPFELGMPIREMKLMQAAGMTPMQIILAGTRNAARVCSLPDHGTLEAAKTADVLVVDGNPLEGLDALKRTFLVIHNGERIR